MIIGGVLVLLTTIVTSILILFGDKMPFGELGTFIMLLINFAIVGYIVIMVAGWRKPIAKAVSGIPNYVKLFVVKIILIPTRIALPLTI